MIIRFCFKEVRGMGNIVMKKNTIFSHIVLNSPSARLIIW